MNDMLQYLSLMLVMGVGLAFVNPGMLITVPFPQSPIALDLNLPLAIPDIVVNSLELSNIVVRSASYNWKFLNGSAPVNISQSKISFNWNYKADAGTGFFTESDLGFTFDYTFSQNSDSYFEIYIKDTKIKIGKMHVAFGGNVKETVVIEVTNLILNHASILFRKFIGDQIAHSITKLAEFIEKDQILYCNQAKTCLHLNTKLVTSPILLNNILILQINGEIYVNGQARESLAPAEPLKSSNSTTIEIQVHMKLLQKLLQKLMKIQVLQKQIHTSEITSTVDINSQCLASLFPKMRNYDTVKDVILDIKFTSIKVSMADGAFDLKGEGTLGVSTQNFNEKAKVLYMDLVNASAAVTIKPIFGPYYSSIRIQTLSILTFKPAQRDIDEGRVRPEMLTQYFDVVTEWVKDAINLAANRKILKLQKSNWIIAINGRNISTYAYAVNLSIRSNDWL